MDPKKSSTIPERRFRAWGVCLKETDELIGDCGLVRQTVDGRTEIEIGYHIHKKCWSRGFSTEAAKGCKEYGFHQLFFNKLICLIDPKILLLSGWQKKLALQKKKRFLFLARTIMFIQDIRNNLVGDPSVPVCRLPTW